MRIRNVIVGVALALATIGFTPVTANATVNPAGAAAAPLPVPKTRSYITLVHPQVTTMVADCPCSHSCFYDLVSHHHTSAFCDRCFLTFDKPDPPDQTALRH